MIHRSRVRPLLACALCAAAFAAEAPPTVPTPPEPKLPEVGRLFFTPAERAELDRIRVGILDSVDPSHAARTMQLDGVVQQTGKAAVYWINGQRYKGREIAGATVTPTALSSSTVVVRLPPPDAREMALKVGQTLDPAGGNLREVYQRPPQELNQLLQILSKRGQAPQKKDKDAAPDAPPAVPASAAPPPKP